MANTGPYSSFEASADHSARGRHRAPDGDDESNRQEPPVHPGPEPGRPAPPPAAAPGWSTTPGGYPPPATDVPAPYGARGRPAEPPTGPVPPDDQTARHPVVPDRSGHWDEPDAQRATGPDQNSPDRNSPDWGPQQPAAPAGAPSKRQAGRNLPAAIGVGVGLGALVLASLFVWRPAFLLVLAAGVVLGTWEMVRALDRAAEPAKRARPPLAPLLVGALAMEGLAWFGGEEALTLGLVFTVAAVLIWRLADGPAGYRRDVTAATLVAAYVAFLAGFGVLLARTEDGAWRVVLALAMVVCSDTGGYIVGVLLGRHRMAPKVSPGKSWEGFGGSVVVAALVGAPLLHIVFDCPWWYGAVFGMSISLVSVLGDLAESLLKRDLGIKDMGHLLPGHGGVMDRLDSILFAMPVAFALLSVMAPPG